MIAKRTTRSYTTIAIPLPFATPNDSRTPGLDAFVGSRGDAYDNAMAESVIGLFKTEVIRHMGPWRCRGDVEDATGRVVQHVPVDGTARIPSPSGVRSTV